MLIYTSNCKFITHVLFQVFNLIKSRFESYIEIIVEILINGFKMCVLVLHFHLIIYELDKSKAKF